MSRSAFCVFAASHYVPTAEDINTTTAAAANSSEIEEKKAVNTSSTRQQGNFCYN